METQVDEEPQQASHLPVDALHVAQAGAELLVESEDVGADEVADELCHVRGNRRTETSRLGTRNRRLVGIGNRLRHRGARGRDALGRRETFGSNGLRRLPRGDVGAGHAARELDGVAPERPESFRATHREPDPQR